MQPKEDLFVYCKRKKEQFRKELRYKNKMKFINERRFKMMLEVK